MVEKQTYRERLKAASLGADVPIQIPLPVYAALLDSSSLDPEYLERLCQAAIDGTKQFLDAGAVQQLTPIPEGITDANPDPDPPAIDHRPS